MIEVNHITKRYGSKLAVNDISFTVQKGEILGFLGPNGAGKSTTMNIITGYLSTTEGSVKIDGIDVLENPAQAKKNIGFLPEHPPLYMDMTVREYLEFVYELKACKLKRKEHLAEISELVKISDVFHRRIGNLSKGYKQRVGLAQALIGNPEVLILDEPTVGLDPKQIIEIRNLITALGKNHTIILSSHILPEVQAVCDKIIVISKGVIVANDTPDNLSHHISGNRRLLARIAGSQEDVLKLLKGMTGIRYCEAMGYKEPGAAEFIIESEANVDIRKPLFKVLAEKGWPLIGLKSLDLSLEDIFIQLVNSGTASAEAQESPAAAGDAPSEETPDETLPEEAQDSVSDDSDEKAGEN